MRSPRDRTRPRAGTLSSVALAAMLAAGAAQANVLDLVRAAPEASWLKVSTNPVSSVWTPGHLRNDYTVQGGEMDRIIYAWSSFAWDSSRSSLTIYGGGHANYGSNDVYTWNGNSLLWERSSLPSRVDLRMAGAYSYGFAADGSMNAPAAAHTYDNTVYLKASDRYMTFGGAAFNNGGVYLKDNGDGTFTRTGPYMFDLSRADPNKVGGTTGSGVDPNSEGGQMWQNRDSLAPQNGVRKPKSFVDGFSDATVVGGKDVIYVGGAQDGTAMDLYRYTIHDLNDPSQDSWELVGINWNTLQTGDSAGALDPVRQVFARTGDATRPFLFWDVSQSGFDNLDSVIRPLDLTGGLAPTNFRGYGLAYDAGREHFVVWGGGQDVWALMPPDGDFATGQWTIDRLALTGGFGPGPLDTIGVLGKWQYAPDLDSFVALQGPTTGDVWIYKPAGWVDPLPVPEPATFGLMALGVLGLMARRRLGSRSA